MKSLVISQLDSSQIGRSGVVTNTKIKKKQCEGLKNKLKEVRGTIVNDMYICTLYTYEKY